MPPERKPQGRRSAKGNQKIMNVVLWVAPSGTPWRDLPDYYGPWNPAVISYPVRPKTACGLLRNVSAISRQTCQNARRVLWKMYAAICCSLHR
ncbi:transposase [Paenibacillus peoriae]|uniref:transposase n=1 Tax=Paenibacillus peoriae TaxID=59893 RepID=UPI0009B6BA44